MTRTLSAVLTAALLCTAAPHAAAGNNDARRAYDKARSHYFALKDNAAWQKYRDKWLAVIKAFRAVAEKHPRSDQAAAAGYTIAELWSDMYKISRYRGDIDQALAAYAEVAQSYPESSLADDALWQRAQLFLQRRGDKNAARNELTAILQRYPQGDMAQRARRELKAIGGAVPTSSERQKAVVKKTSDKPPAQNARRPLPAIGHPITKRHIVIDPGHGGNDSGAVGPNKAYEKDVSLRIAQKVKAKLEADGVEVTLTRTDDSYVSLEERTALANRLNASAFISIHTNAIDDPKVRGIETYFLDVTDNRYAIRLAAVENQSSESQVSDLELILADLTTKAHTADSRNLAHTTQKALVEAVSKRHGPTKDLGVKGSLFYVLLGARMPAILIETSFLSHPTEGPLLLSSAYQQTLADAIAGAVTQHLDKPLTLGAR